MRGVPTSLASLLKPWIRLNSYAADPLQLRHGDDGCTEVFPAAVQTALPQRSLNVTSTRCNAGLVLSYVLANTPMESNGQGWGAWSSLVEMC